MKYPISVGLAFLALLFVSAGCSDAERPDAAAPGGKGVESGSTTEDIAQRQVPPNPQEEVNADGVIVSHAVSLRSAPKYPADFQHFDYVNPDAPRGGTFSTWSRGTYDSFHRYGQRGDSVVGSALFYDTLMTGSEDEIQVYYGLIAEKVEYPPEYDWIIFHLRPEARHQDGKRITAEDVVFSFNKFWEEGVPQFKLYYKLVTDVQALDEGRVKFNLSEGNKEILVSLATLTIIPPQYWEGRDFSEPLTEVPIGSGAYTVSDYSIGQYVVFERKADYWALDLPVNRGQLNFDLLRFDYYKDEDVSREAFKAGEYDFRTENVAKAWATQYNGPNFDKRYIVKVEEPNENPPGMQSLVFNTSRPVFQDRRVRQALTYALDFEWLNDNLFYGQYTRSRSFFQNTPFEAAGLPGPEELKILEPIRDQIPEEVFTGEYRPPVTDGSGTIRAQIREALAILKEAGWEVQDQKLVNVETGEPMEFELLLYSTSFERIAIPIQENMEKLGVTMNIRLVDTTQFINRLREGDYDLISGGFGGSFFPEANLQITWRSDFIDSTYNTARVQDPAIDYLVDGIADNQQDNEVLQDWGRAFDRVLQWNHYVMPEWHISKYRVAYWDKFSRPAVRPKYSLGEGTWWFDPEKAAKLPERRSN